MASNGGKIASAIVVASAVGLLGFALTKTASAAIPPKCDPFDITIAGSSAVDTGINEDYTVTVYYNNSPVTSTVVTLTEQTTSFTSTALTNSQGIASFTVNFSNAGTYVLVATVDGCSSANFTVTTRTPCGKDQIRINGVCTDVNLDLIASATIFTGLPATITFTAKLTTASGNPVSGYPITLDEITTKSTATEDTGTNGECQFNVTLTKYGEYVFEATA
jgi:hypothetical protein